MAFNPPVTNSGLPLRVDGEFLVLQRKNVEIEVKVDGTTGKKTAKGTVISSIYFFINNDSTRSSSLLHAQYSCATRKMIYSCLLTFHLAASTEKNTKHHYLDRTIYTVLLPSIIL